MLREVSFVTFLPLNFDDFLVSNVYVNLGVKTTRETFYILPIRYMVVGIESQTGLYAWIF